MRPALNTDSPCVIYVMSEYKDLVDDKVAIEIRWDEQAQVFKIDTMVSFPMPINDKTYWKEEVANHEELSWNEMQDKLYSLTHNGRNMPSIGVYISGLIRKPKTQKILS